MSDSRATATPDEPEIAAWSELFQGGRALYTILVVVGTAIYALQTLVITIVMPTVVADIGGANFYAWPAMLYTIGAIVGAASLGPVWAAFGQRRGYAASGLLFGVATTGCALAPDIGTLIVARAFQGFSGGLITGGGMALVSILFTGPQRKRVLALYQGTWMICQLMGPAVGGAFAEIGWWRGSFWVMAPVVLAFGVLAWLKIPEGSGGDAVKRSPGSIPFLRLVLLTGGVFAVALAGPVFAGSMRFVMIGLAVVLVVTCLKLDARSENRLYPTGALSIFTPVGLGLWIMMLGGMAQTTVNVFMPLLLQVVHGVTPLFVSFIAIVVSAGWTTSTFLVSSYSGRREALSLKSGPLLMIIGMGSIAICAQLPLLWVLTVSAFVLGLGVGAHNVLLVTRIMGSSKAGEEGITGSSVPSIRSLGTAFGAAIGGMVSTIAGLGDGTDPAAVGPAVNAVFAVNLIPIVIASVFMFMLLARTAKTR
jgi:MFS family permease